MSEGVRIFFFQTFKLLVGHSNLQRTQLLKADFLSLIHLYYKSYSIRFNFPHVFCRETNLENRKRYIVLMEFLLQHFFHGFILNRIFTLILSKAFLQKIEIIFNGENDCNTLSRNILLYLWICNVEFLTLYGFWAPLDPP